jgi:hypothetical protein
MANNIKTDLKEIDGMWWVGLIWLRIVSSDELM